MAFLLFECVFERNRPVYFRQRIGVVAIGGDDLIATLSMKDGKVGGFWIK